MTWWPTGRFAKSGCRSTRRADQFRRARSFELLEHRVLLANDLVMFNDHVAGPLTHPFATTYAANLTAAGQLRNSDNGGATSIMLATESIGATYESLSSRPAPGTDAYETFAAWIDFSSQRGSSIALSGGAAYVHTFSGLSAEQSYEFAGTAVRSSAGFADHWTLVTLVGADWFIPAHSSGAGIVTDGLATNQVAIWTGENHRADQGFVVSWSEIDPGDDGKFAIRSEQYQGPTPGVGTGNSTGSPKGYGLAAVRLVERDLTFHVVSSDPPTGTVLTKSPTSYTVNFNLPVDAATVQAGDLLIDGITAVAAEVIATHSVKFTLPAVSGNGLHTVTLAEGAIRSSEVDLALASFSGSFAILSGSGIVINEVNYDSGDDSKPWEYVELFNLGAEAVDLSAWTLNNAVSFTIPNGTSLASGEYLLISQHPAEMAAEYGVASLGPFDGRLSNDGETLTLRDDLGVKQDEVDYQLGFPWPTTGGIPGHSIQLINPALTNDLGGNWRSAAVTPGAANAVFALNSAPQMRQVNHSPTSPKSGQDVAITMKITDPEGVQSAALEYQLVDPGNYIEISDPRYATSWTAVEMRDGGSAGDAIAGDDIYTAILPGHLQTHRRLVRYRVTAVDVLGASATAPYADDPQPNFAYFVYNQTPDWSAAVQPGVTPIVDHDAELLDSVATYHLITTRQDHVDAQFISDSNRNNGYSGSDYLWHGALVYDGVVYDHIRFRARGGVWRYAMGKNMWKFDFNRGHGFEARDNYGNKYEVPWSKLNLGANIQQRDSWHRGEQGLFESVGFKLFDLAGVPAPNTNFVHFRIIESADEQNSDQYSTDFQGLYLAVEQLDDQFLEQHGLPDGNLYKMENNTGVEGIGGEANNQGDYPAASDSSDLIEFKTTYENGSQSAQWWQDNLNLESYYSYRAIVEAIHHYDIGNGKNYFYYLNPDTDKWEVIPWDIDLTWADNMYGDGEEPFKTQVLTVSEFGVAYRNRLREIRDLLYNTEQVGWLVDEMASFIDAPGEVSFVDADRAMWDYNPILVSDYVIPSKAGHGRFYAGGDGIPPTGNFAGMMQRVKSYVASRSEWIDARILGNETQIPATPVLSYTGESGFPVDGLQFTTSAYSSRASSFGAMEWRIAEISNPSTQSFDSNADWIYEIDAVWESGELTSFGNSMNVTGAALQVGHTYRARVRMQDLQGRWSHWSDPVEFVAAEASMVPTLSITELHYHPNNPALANEEDQEFIEILNTGDQTVDLSGIQITEFAGSSYVFADGLTLESGDYIVVARTPEVFESIYGTGTNLAPDGYSSANLSNGGETIALVSASGVMIQSFTYRDNNPWPQAADGAGPSLEIIDPLGDPGDPANWRASELDGGSPGTDGNSQPHLAGDYDRSGAVDEQDYDQWKSQFGISVAVAGEGADGNMNGVVDAGDYSVWRDNVQTTATAPTLGPFATEDFQSRQRWMVVDAALEDLTGVAAPQVRELPLTVARAREPRRAAAELLMDRRRIAASNWSTRETLRIVQIVTEERPVDENAESRMITDWLADFALSK